MDYEISEGKVVELKIPKEHVKMLNMENGVHVKMSNITFKSTMKVTLKVGVLLFEAGVPGDITVETNNAEVDIALRWQNFTLKPNVTVKADFDIKYGGLLSAASLLPEAFSKQAKIYAEKNIPSTVSDYITQVLNPHLSSLRRVYVGLGLSQFDIYWRTQNQTISMAMRPKSAGPMKEALKHNQNGKMVCITSEILSAFRQTSRAKREVFASNLVKKAAPVLISCKSPQGTCSTSSCSYCVDIRINPPSARNGTSGLELLSTCLPK
ncbi:unnamed protein product [Cylicocyclus nassatus]|uniref:Uncharacterized protein n=1 Tax=Cylicocyclus nassatus TaxID=53992 RepID=A0AA36DSP2_CYLNA|nr:unnamed protein product [Cylicocyclus nassatus]